MRVEMEGRTPIKLWTTSPQGDVPGRGAALAQLRNIASLPFVFRHVAAMPDVHLGMGATVGSVIATRGAIVPAAVGVDIGCGMEAVRTTLRAVDLPDSLGGGALGNRAGGPARPHEPRRAGRPRRVGRAAGRGRGSVAIARQRRALRAARRAAPEGRPQREPRARTSARSAPATTSSSCASTRRTACG